MYVTCALCGLVVPMQGIDTGSLPTCKCKIQVTFSDHTTVSPLQTEGFRTFIKNMREWNVTLHGEIEGSSELFKRFFEKPAKEPVPDAFQNAFRDGELEL